MGHHMVTENARGGALAILELVLRFFLDLTPAGLQAPVKINSPAGRPKSPGYARPASHARDIGNSEFCAPLKNGRQRPLNSSQPLPNPPEKEFPGADPVKTRHSCEKRARSR
jgi:hypothetical protein